MADRELIEAIFAQKRSSYDLSLKDDDAFEIFCADIILNNYDPSIDELESGIVDGSKDAGIDAVYVFVNRRLVAEDTDLTVYKNPVDIRLIIIQSKNEDSFKEGPVNTLAGSLPSLFRDFAKDKAKLATSYNKGVIDAFENYHRARTELAPEFPTFAVEIYYACKGHRPSSAAQTRASALEQTLKELLPSQTQVSFTFLGAAELYALAGKQKQLTAQLPVVQSPLAGKENSYIVLTTIDSYGAFISDDLGNLRSRFFESNVRDYEGDVDVNKDIASSLRDTASPVDFWWLNNGITILSEEVAFIDNKMHIKNPLIVNGLQTSHEIHRYVTSKGNPDQRYVMVRIVKTSDEDVINKIIKATNFQTKVKAASLRATELIHRKVELYLHGKNVYYDRRRNYYKNQGKPSSRIVSIERMAQSVISILLDSPHAARGRPTTLITKDDYDRIFPSAPNEYNLKLYLVAAELLIAVNQFLKASALEQIHKNNLRFHLLMALGWWLGGSQNMKPEQVANIDISKLSSAPIGNIMNWLVSEFDKAGKNDAVAKDANFTSQLKSEWNNAKSNF